MYHPMQGTWDESPHTQDDDPFLWPNERVSMGSHQRSLSPQLRTGRQGAPFYPQGPDSAVIGQFASDLKMLSAQIKTVMEADERHTKTMEVILSEFEMMKTRLSALEDRCIDGVQERKSGGSSQIGSNNHLSLKVSHRRGLSEALG